MSTPNSAPPPISFDSLLPPEIAAQAEQIGARKATMDLVSLFLLSLLAGGFIAIGAILATTAATGAAGLSYGVVRLLMGLTFSVGLIMVVVGGAELFTGNNLIVMAFASGKIPLRALLVNWVVVYLGNFVASVVTAWLMVAAGHHLLADGASGALMLKIGAAKTQLGFGQALILGVFCNALVCMAVWMCYGARTTTGRVLAIIPPITAFVAAGFEHSVANMYFIPAALFVKQLAGTDFWSQASLAATQFDGLTWGNFITRNLVPVTIGNIIGGSGLVGTMYWLVYLRRRPSQ